MNFILSKSVAYHATFLIVLFFFWDYWGRLNYVVLFGYIGYWAYFFYKKHEKNTSLSQSVNEYNRVIYNQFYALGTTKDERNKNIQKIFDEKKQTVYFQWYYIHSTHYQKRSGDWATDNKCYKRIGLKRNLVSMDNRESDFLRLVFMLFNEGIISESNYCYYLFVFVYGDGKAAITEYDSKVYGDEDKLSGSQVATFIKQKWDTSIDRATNHILSVLADIDKYGSVIDLKSFRKIERRIQGNSAWLSEDELDDTVFNRYGNHRLLLGDLKDSETPVYYSGEGSLITIAPPGAGKTQCFVIPNMLHWRGAAVVLDIKGEIYKDTRYWREMNIGKVFKFSPLDPDNSHSYNPLDFVRDDPDYIWEDARFLADMMIVPSGSQDPFWENMARDVLTAAIAYVIDSNEESKRSMSKVLDIIYGIGWDDMILSLKTNILVSSMKRIGNALDDIDKKQRDSILKTAQSSLSAWQGERIAKVTNKSDWNPLDLRNGTPTIYICINPNEIESYLSLIRVFIAQHIRMLTTQLPERGSTPVLFMLDELPRLKKMPPIEEALNIGRQYGIKLWMFAQSYGQLKEAYSDPEGLIGSCAVRTFMNLPLNDEFTQKLSDQLGYNHNVLNNSKKKVVEPIELAGPEYKDLILMTASGTKPAKLTKKFAYEDDLIRKKINGQIEL